jgi:hypothetical protein
METIAETTMTLGQFLAAQDPPDGEGRGPNHA